MHIKKLELYGFKSFPDRTTLHFGRGVSCIVGPNGCGKSNIVDALRWCIGEQSAKSLRGGEMLDVIFAGSAQRKPVGFAEVVLSFTAEADEPFPGEYARFTELSVGRRLHRSGTSEYTINQTRVRRRDLIDLFLDSGVGNNLYSFIEQGRIGKIVHARPIERRSLIDEAAGISRYKIRRDEAQKRLEATGAQLDRAADVSEEMGRRLRTLGRQVLKAARFRRLRALIRHREVVLSLAKYSALSGDRRALRGQLQEARTKAAQNARELARRESDLAERREEINVVESASGTWRDEVAELDARHREQEGARSFTGRRRDELTQHIAGARGDAEAAEVEAEAARTDADKAAKDGARLVAEREQADATRRAAQSDVDQAEAAQRDATKVVGAAHREALIAEAATESARERRALVEQRLGAIPQLRAERAGIVSGAVEELAELSTQLHATQATLEAVRDEADGLRARLDELEPKAPLRAELLAAAEGDLRRVEQQQREQRQALESRVRELRDFADGRRALASQALVEGDALRARRIGEARADQEREQSQLLDDQQGSMGQARERGARWVQARMVAQRAEVEARRRRVSAARRAAEERERVELSEARAQAREAVEQARSVVEAEVEQVVDGARHEAQAARGRRDQLVQELRGAEAQLLKAEQTRARCEMTQARAGEALELLLRGSEAASAVADALPQVKVLGDYVPQDDTRDWLGTVLDERLRLPAVSTWAELDRAAIAARDRGEASVLLVREGDPLEQVLDTPALVDDLRAAFTHFVQTGGPAVVRGTGERVDTDGVVHLGRRGQIGERSMALRAERAEAELAGEQAQLAVNVSSERCLALERDLEGAVVALDRAESALSEAEAEGRGRVAAVLQRAEREASDRLDGVEVEQTQARDARRGAEQVDASALLARHDGQREHDQSGRRAGLAALEASHAKQLDRVRRQAEQRSRAARDAAEAEVEALVALRRAQADRAQQDWLDAVRAGEEEAAAMTERTESIRAERETARAEVEALTHRLFEVRTQASAHALAIGKAESTARECVARQKLLGERRAEAELTVQALDDEVVGLERSVGLARSSEGDRVEQQRALASRVDRAEADLESNNQELQRSRQARADVEVLRATLKERAAAAQQAAEGALERADLSTARGAKATELASQLDGERVESERALADLDVSIGELVVARAAAWDLLQREKERLGTLRGGLREAEQALRSLVDARESAGLGVTGIEAQVAQVRGQIDGLRQRIDERYQISLPGLLDRLDAQGVFEIDVDDAVREPLTVDGTTVQAVAPFELRLRMLTDHEGITALVVELEQARERLAVLGEVNLAALQEYEGVSARHNELETQRADLEASVARIRSAIAKMNRTCRQRFRDTFDQVNEVFQEMYPKLVGGGLARLALTDEEDLLETGVDIFVQPPGKRLQNLSLLSGGEKAMTAIALIMSLFHVKPSPFCVLDEVDAPLDEANGSRFNEAIREMAQRSQLILITHNRKTMECADTLYGITMPTPGVSRLVSVQL